MSRADAPAPQRFYSLDVLRGVAALSVVFWHWQHFFVGTRPGIVANENLPLFSAFSLLYRHGWMAVDLFFALSGFVFFWLYARKVAASAISPWTFAVLRLSRLYPLHLLTLLLVAGGQYWFMSRLGAHFVYAHNDTPHFLLNLAFASSWGLERGLSFNAPVWSVSVEVMLYALFYLYCRLLPVRLPALLALALCGYLLAHIYAPLGRGIGSFFLGGATYFAYVALARSARAATYERMIGALAAGAWLLGVAAIWSGAVQLAGPVQFNPAQPGVIAKYWVTAFLFPLTILWLALTETRHGGFGRKYAFLGDLSYSSYLLHFPLQMLVMGVLIQARATQEVFYSPVLLLLFFAVLIAVSLASHRYFEVPVQRYLREKCRAAG